MNSIIVTMGLLPDTQNCGLRMRRECRERFPHHRFQRKPLVSDPGMHHGTCVKHVPWCMSGSLTNGGRENVPGIPGACATRNFAYLVRGPLVHLVAYCLFGTKPLYETMMTIGRIAGNKFKSNVIRMQRFSITNMHLKMSSANYRLHSVKG